MDEEAKCFVACIPCLEGMQMGYTPYKNSTVARCSRCDCRVWLGPRSREEVEKYGYEIMCIPCIVKEQGPEALEAMIPLSNKGPGE